jgi:hypothetical protein
MLINRIRIKGETEFGLQLLPRDVAKLIAKMVWKTRTQSIWDRAVIAAKEKRNIGHNLSFVFQRKCSLHMCSALTREGVAKAFEWLEDEMK